MLLILNKIEFNEDLFSTFFTKQIKKVDEVSLVFEQGMKTYKGC